MAYQADNSPEREEDNSLDTHELEDRLNGGKLFLCGHVEENEAIHRPLQHSSSLH